jgi:hypothetical protein
MKPREAPDNWDTGAVDDEKATALPPSGRDAHFFGTDITQASRSATEGVVHGLGYALKAAWHPAMPSREKEKPAFAEAGDDDVCPDAG